MFTLLRWKQVGMLCVFCIRRISKKSILVSGMGICTKIKQLIRIYLYNFGFFRVYWAVFKIEKSKVMLSSHFFRLLSYCVPYWTLRCFEWKWLDFVELSIRYLEDRFLSWSGTVHSSSWPQNLFARFRKRWLRGYPVEGLHSQIYWSTVCDVSISSRNSFRLIFLTEIFLLQFW